MTNAERVREAAIQMEQWALRVKTIAAAAPPPSFGVGELPPLCDVENPSDPENKELVLCYILARLTYLLQYIECAASVNPAACAEAACNLYHDATTQCEVDHR